MANPKFENSDQQEYYGLLSPNAAALTLTPATLVKRANELAEEIRKAQLNEDAKKKKKVALFWAFKQKLKENEQEKEFKLMLAIAEQWDDLEEFLADQFTKKPKPTPSKAASVPLVPVTDVFAEFRILRDINPQDLYNRFENFVKNNSVLLGLQLIIRNNSLRFDSADPGNVKKDVQRSHLAQFLHLLVLDGTIDKKPVQQQANVSFPMGNMFGAPKPVPGGKKVDEEELAKRNSSFGAPLLRPKNPTDI